MSERLKDKVAIITGAAMGIGRAAAVRFAQEGAFVCVADRYRDGGQETVRLIKKNGGSDALFVPVDVARADEVEKMVSLVTEHFGRVDILVNAAAIVIGTPKIPDVPEESWDLVLDTNLKGTFLCLKYAIPAMLRNGNGSIVNLASMSGVSAVTSSVPYAVTKAGVIHLTRLAAMQFAGQGIRVNSISPGMIDTAQSRGVAGSTEEFQRRVSGIPGGCVGQPEDAANLILFLASDEASYISGINCIIDKGRGLMG